MKKLSKTLRSQYQGLSLVAMPTRAATIKAYTCNCSCLCNNKDTSGSTGASTGSAVGASANK